MKKHRGFTLIELLVVIAIIGILASIVLVSLGGARTSAKDAAIKANLDQMRLIAELEYTNNGSYANTTADTNYIAAKANIEANDGTVTENFTTDKYCVQSTLPGGGSWCLDSVGSVGSTAISCDATNYNCAAD